MKIAAIILGAVTIFCVTAAHADDDGTFQWKCRDTGKNSKQCDVKNTGHAAAEICMDVVKVCNGRQAGGEHSAQFCSGRLKPNEVDTKVVKDFYPKVGLFERCSGTEFRNKVVTP